MDYVAGEMMNEQAQKVLIDLLNRATSGIDKAVEFSQAQIPDVVNQLLMWNFTISLIYFISGIAIIPVWLIAYRKLLNLSERLLNNRNEELKLRKQEAKEAFASGESWTRFGGGGGITSVKYDSIMSANEWISNATYSMVILLCTGAFSIFMAINLVNFTWIKIWIAPKLYLIEYAASLVK